MFANDHEAEIDASKRYNEGILICGTAKDYATREILESILNDEDGHIDSIEAVQDQIGQMGIQLFLSTQTG
jgi:bacterioferritin